MKNLLNKLNFDLSNLKEKSTNEYIDVDMFDIFEMPKDIPEIWNYLAKTIDDFYNKDPFKYTDSRKRIVYNVDDKLSNEIGFNNIQIHFYKGQDIGYQSSNFIYDKKYNLLYIDLYFCETYIENEVYELILQELYNFKRDVEWIIEGENVYNEKITEMKERKTKFKNFII